MNRFQPVTVPVQVIHGDGSATDRSQSRGCRTAAGGPATEAGPEKGDEAEKAEAAQGRARRRCRGSPFPDPEQAPAPPLRPPPAAPPPGR